MNVLDLAITHGLHSGVAPDFSFQNSKGEVFNYRDGYVLEDIP